MKRILLITLLLSPNLYPNMGDAEAQKIAFIYAKVMDAIREQLPGAVFPAFQEIHIDENKSDEDPFASPLWQSHTDVIDENGSITRYDWSAEVFSKIQYNPRSGKTTGEVNVWSLSIERRYESEDLHLSDRSAKELIDLVMQYKDLGDRSRAVAKEAQRITEIFKSKAFAYEQENRDLIRRMAANKKMLYKWGGSERQITTEPFFLPSPRLGFKVKWMLTAVDEQYDDIYIRVYDARDNSHVQTFNMKGTGRDEGWINMKGPSYYLEIDADSLFEVKIEIATPESVAANKHQ